MFPFDRSLLAHNEREKLLRGKGVFGWQNYIVNVLGKDGKVFTATVEGIQLGPNGILTGDHAGLLWWPFTYG